MDRREQVNFCEQKAPRKLPYTPFSDTSSQGSCNRLPQNYYSVKPMKIKFICNFGGRFLPRPSDGELRYVGGEKHLVKISRDISWQELICKTTKLIRRAHMIKYHLPGEQVNMLISITCDDDLCNMIDECIVLERNKARLTMYLFSDINDENYVHFALGNSSDTEKEAQFIALVNGLVRPGEELRKQTIRSTSAIDLELMFGINEEGLQAGKTDEASLGNKSKLPQSIITVPQKTPPSSQTEVTKQYYEAQINEGNPLSAARKMSNGYLDSSVSYESTHIAKEEAGGHAISRHQPGLQKIATNMIGQSQAKEKGSPRKQLLIPVDNSTAKIVSSKPNNNSPIPHISRLVYEMPAPLSRGSEKIMNQPTSFDDNKMKPGKYSTEEEAIFHLSLPNKIDMSECSQEPGTPTRCHDDMHNSPKLHALEKPVATKSLQKQQAPVNCTMKKDHPSNPTSGETVLSCSSIFSDRTTELQPNILARASSEIEQERPNSQRSHEKLSKMARSRSVGADSISPRIKTPPEEAKDNFSPLTTEFEVSETIVTGVGVEAVFHDPGSSILDHGSPPTLAHSETKNSEQTLPVNAVMERDHLSNVQIIGNEDLEDLREMGSGAFGTVFHGRWKGTDVAIKRIKNSCFMYPSSQADKLIIEFWKEAAIISKLHHPNILAFYGVVNNGPGGTLATVTEFMVNGSLKKVLLHKNKYLDWRKRIMLAMDAAIGMEYLHSKEIVHFDLKCDNLLVNVKDPSRPICKVADFGLSKMKQASLVSGGMRGTLPWMAPELLTMSGTKVSEKVDVYSFGVVLWEILTGEDPYDGMHYGGVIGGILSNTLRPPVPTSCNPEWRKLMEQCWSTEPERRPSFTEVATCLRSMLEASQSGNLS